ncbi:PASTA domain-containing protein [Fulvivirga sedimenti]|uniref:PASTA domain-containing protein n=1 Tax=Fulvivirga sedimenti TaxID=2879465 RepID=A0A9X1HSN0_9BACT|nr:PASTA domain-containing protein [Fulvivirga sedimenti]MCA6074885.1 PASTA domain-containing protein [Fulvivirga sedimenti]MCA6076062.1 PASTA domain-containing protein [Fulvivirga sedimenti]MCA6077190.1 PASTA domain-containing protein [Fulvivirga sedimenti]
MNIFSNNIKALLINLGIMSLLLLGALLIFFFVYLPNKTNHGETVTVPDLEGIHMDNVEQYVVQRNLRYEVNDSAYSDDFPPLTILKQYPKAGSKVKEGRKIFISVNRVNPPSVPVPDLVNQSSLRNAEAVLKSNELRRGNIDYKPSPFLNLVLEMYHDGKIIKAGDRLPKGSVIDLVVGNGFARSNIPTPDLIGQNYEDATFIILGSSLQVGQVSLEVDTARTRAVIIRQSPKAGTEIKMGDPIDLWLGNPADTVRNEPQAMLNN